MERLRHAYYSLEMQLLANEQWDISDNLALAYLKCVRLRLRCAIQFQRILQRHLPNSAPFSGRNKRRVQQTKHWKETTSGSRSQEATMHHLHSPMGAS